MKTVIEMALNSGDDEWKILVRQVMKHFPDEFERFAELVRLDEREVCSYKAGIAVLGADRGLANRVDQAIRSRSKT